MSDCDNKWVGEFPLTGSGNEKKDAEENFTKRLEEQLKRRREELKCQNKSCIKEAGLGDNEGDGPVCLFGYARQGDDEAKPVKRTFQVFNPKTGRYQTIEDKEIWEKTQTIKYGCWCFV